MSDGSIDLTVEGPLAIITVTRPEKLNALTPAMIDGLAAAADRIDRADDVDCAILTGAGDRAFCVGADINAWAALEPLEMWRRWVRDGHAAYDRIARMRQPVIAAINGLALGGGLELALAADIRIADEGAELGLPEASIATVPGWAGSQRLPHLVGPAHAKELMFTARPVSAARAAEIGLVNRVAASGQAMKAARAMAKEILSRAPVSVQIVKQLIDAAQGTGLAANLEGLAGALAATTEDAKEGVSSFREKRTPEFKGR